MKTLIGGLRRSGPLLAWASVFGVAALATGVAVAEGAVRLLECEFVRTCDAGGFCETSSGAVTFRMEPIEIEASGSTRYVLTYGDTEAEMRALSDAGPFVWVSAVERDVLVPSSETEWLWHRLVLDPAPAAQIRFMHCGFRQ